MYLLDVCAFEGDKICINCGIKYRNESDEAVVKFSKGSIYNVCPSCQQKNAPEVLEKVKELKLGKDSLLKIKEMYLNAYNLGLETDAFAADFFYNVGEILNGNESKMFNKEGDYIPSETDLDKHRDAFIAFCEKAKSLKYLSSFKTEYEEVKQYGIENDDFQLLIWNCDNAEAFDHRHGLEAVIERLQDFEDSGNVHDRQSGNQLMFELNYK